jgi:UDP-GlcNAc:undecaprenyl-phosphate GlcNAc-1-phosphate transferase
MADLVPPSVVYIFGTIIIAVFIIGGCNATNLIDGLDGLAAGVCAIACCGFLIVAALIVRDSNLLTDPGMDIVRMCVILATLGALVGFLPFNFNPASIFMGDAGSLLLGYLCMSSVLLFTTDTGNSAPKLITALLIIFALPITEVLLTIVRRKIQGKPITAPDNEHIHHLLRRSGLSVKASVLIMYTAACFLAILGVMMVVRQMQWRYLLAVFFPLYVFIIVFAYHYGQNLVLREQMENAESSIDEPHV